ncbi:sugar transferase [Agromyces humi]|uniref:sugar transferase n=1 Tax=Agromyces humi TaxID=1766800 RepID=UPI00135CF4E3|nr:sugar transferase [Agromyces humi]
MTRPGARPYDVVKRGLDVVGAVLGLIVSAPVMVAVAIAIAVHIGRPVLFVQRRPGRQGQPFHLLKFRSMLPTSPNHVADEDRLTEFGRRLRASSLDELPTLWNVLKGDMSLVGPRPLLPEYLSRYSPEQARRHEVRPGITGLAQVRGRNAITWEERLYWDVVYVDHRSLALDARILAQTFAVVLRREGVAAPGHATMYAFPGGENDRNRP